MISDFIDSMLKNLAIFSKPFIFICTLMEGYEATAKLYCIDTFSAPRMESYSYYDSFAGRLDGALANEQLQ